MVRRLHPPYSPDLVPSDQVGYLKNKLQGRYCETGEDISVAIIELTDTIESATLETVFLKWMETLEKCISPNGEYVGGHESEIEVGMLELTGIERLILH
jgi:hypothetical protein